MSSQNFFHNYFETVAETLNGIDTGALERAATMVQQAHGSGKKVILAGNGGSAAEAQHIATEFVVRFRRQRRALPVIALTTDTSVMTAIGNDFDFDQVFARQVEALVTKDDLVVSNASCTTNCLSPVAKVLNDAIGIEKGMMTTIHSYTGDQPTLDTMHKDLYRGRAAAMSMIPTSTGAAKAVGLVLPELNGKLDGFAMRVPTPNVSVVDLKFIAKRETTVDEINAAIRSAADGAMKGVLGYTDAPNVSIDFNHNPHSSVFHMDQTKVMDGTLCSVLSWYDNEWGFSTRMSDTAIEMAKYI